MQRFSVVSVPRSGNERAEKGATSATRQLQGLARTLPSVLAQTDYDVCDVRSG